MSKGRRATRKRPRSGSGAITDAQKWTFASILLQLPLLRRLVQSRDEDLRQATEGARMCPM